MNNTKKNIGLALLNVSGRYINCFNNLYPYISEWFYNKVFNGFYNGRRVLYLTIKNNKIVAISILKTGESTKLCSMHIDDSLRNMGLGSLLLHETSKYALENRSRSIHFTMAEEINNELAPYFEKRGFRNIGWMSNKYRKTIDEFIWKGDIKDLRLNPHIRIPGLTLIKISGDAIEIKNHTRTVINPENFKNRPPALDQAEMVLSDPDWIEELRVPQVISKGSKVSILRGDLRKQARTIDINDSLNIWNNYGCSSRTDVTCERGLLAEGCPEIFREKEIRSRFKNGTCIQAVPLINVKGHC